MENLDKALESVGESIVAEVRKLAKKDKFHATDSLDKSISYKIKGNIVEISANKYIEALSGGIKRQNGSKEDFNQKLENIKAWARTVAVVVPSPATSLVFIETLLINCAPIFSNASLNSISFATVTPSLVTRGPPNFLSIKTFRPFGPKVTFTASDSFSTPARRLFLACSSNCNCFAILYSPIYLLKILTNI